ncbi:MAG: transposase [Nitrospira sp.]
MFPVKYCKALLDEEVTAIIQYTAAEIAERFPIEMEAMGTDKHHIHLLCSAHPSMVPGRIVQIRKSLTAREIFRRKLAVKRVLWAENFGLTGTMWPRSESKRTGRQSSGMCNGKGSRKKVFDSSECFSSVIPRSLLRGASFCRISIKAVVCENSDSRTALQRTSRGWREH